MADAPRAPPRRRSLSDRTPAPVGRCRRRGCAIPICSTVKPKLMTQFGFSNPHQAPTLTQDRRSTVGVGEAIKQPKVLDKVVEELAIITGQRPVRKRAKKSIANFGLRQGQEIGAAVTLRGARMWEFLDRFISVAIPRIRDFRGTVDALVRWSRQLFAGPQGAADLSGDQLRHGRASARMDVTFVTTRNA